MSDIPSDLHRNILLHLPAASLIRFRAVCKSWRRIIDDQSFVRSHTTNNHRSSPNLLIRTSAGKLYSFPLDSLIHVSREQTIHVRSLSHRGAPPLPELPVASCNGLILISHRDANKIWMIWNPLTGDLHELPPLDIKVRLAGCGIGYDSDSDDYKVVRIDEVPCLHQKPVYRTLIYSLRLNSWKKINDCPFDFHCGRESVFLNGALHWRSWNKIIALDLATGKYRRMLLPPERSSPFDTRLDALDGCLVLSDANATERAWVMKDYGVEWSSSWVELFSSGERSVIGDSSGSLWPIAYSKSQRRLILQSDDRIVVWDIGKYSAEKVTVHGLPGSISSQICPGSLFRFKDSGMQD